jgi:succinoglycan biosynthesis protein ExoM
MVRSAILPVDENRWFQPAFGFTGGEDEEFFRRLIAAGARFAVAPHALVHERVPAHRISLGYILRTGFRDGIIETALARSRGNGTFGVIASALCHVARKLGYAVNHLFWSWQASWRTIAALRDVAEASGALVGALGMRGRFYGSG